jgi:hypothetical protein
MGGLRTGVNVDRALALANQLEDEAIVVKLEMNPPGLTPNLGL